MPGYIIFAADDKVVLDLSLLDGACGRGFQAEVISATATTIAVKGGIEPNAAGKSFGLIYDQMIKRGIATPTAGNREVKFFNPKKSGGGYTDSNTPATGICQVCHVGTLYWTSDGANAGHHSGVSCTDCHPMAQGFNP